MTQTNANKRGKSRAKKKTKPSEQPTVLGQIVAALAAIKPNQITVPPLGIPDRPGYEVVGVADNYMQRFFTYYLSAQKQVLALDEKARQVVADLDGQEGDFEQRLTGIMPQISKIRQEHEAAERHVNLVKELFWAEARQRVPALKDRNSLAICSDWNFYVRKETASSDPGHEPLFGGFGAGPFGRPNGHGLGFGLPDAVFVLGPNGPEKAGEGQLPRGLEEIFEAIFGGGDPLGRMRMGFSGRRGPFGGPR